jgi:hypothetical protein
MFWNKTKDPNPLGVPLGDLALMLSTGTIKTSIEGKVLLARHEHYTTRVEVVPPDRGAASDEPIRAVVRVLTELPDPIQEIMRGREAESLAAFNSMAALGALTMHKGRVHVGSRLTIFERENAWEKLHAPLLLFTIIVATEAILGAMRRTIGGGIPNRGKSKWEEGDFENLEEMMSNFCVCSTGGLGFTAEFDLGKGSAAAMTAPLDTALFQLEAGEPHPELGGGLLALLHLPHRLPSTRKAHDVCAELNQLEMAAADLPPHFGAWCPGRRPNTVSYVSFLPNALHRIPNIASNLSMWGMHRALWGRSQLERLAR